MENQLCKTEEEVRQIISLLQNENPNIGEELILKAIASCCLSERIVKENNTFIDCVKERIRMFRQM